jgi:AmmeMemoRadiSam system protein A
MTQVTSNQPIKQRIENSARGELLMIAVTPHPPIMVPEVGRGEDRQVERSQKAMARLGQEIRALQPDTVIFISPHGPIFQDGIALAGTPWLQGDLGQFRAKEAAFKYPNDLNLAQAIAEEAKKAGILTVLLDERLAKRYGVSDRLDHGVMVPLYFLQAEGLRPAVDSPRHDSKPEEIRTVAPAKLVVMAYGLLPFEDLYAFGLVIRRAVEQTGRRAVLIASGDLSHRLTPAAPAGYRPEGEVFDRQICELTAKADVLGLLNLPLGLAEQAGECGLRSLIMAWGAADGRQVNPEVYSYEGPFGVGYMIANLGVGQADPSRQLLEQLREQRVKAIQERRQQESPLVQLARASLETYVRQGKRLEPGPELKLEELQRPAGAFVSIKKDGQLRGCIGTISPVYPTLAQEIIENAISAGTRDPRFLPIEESELDDLVYSVDVLGVPESVTGLDELDPSRYGVIVSHGSRRGLLLPDLEGIDTAEQQVAIARQKAGIGPAESVTLERFEVKRFT